MDVVWATRRHLQAFEKAIDSRAPRLSFIESIANPAARYRHRAIAAISAQGPGVPLISTTRWRRPTYLIRRSIMASEHRGLHSLTKFLGGHGNSIGGIIVRRPAPSTFEGQQIPMAERAGPDITASSCRRTFGNFCLQRSPARVAGPAARPWPRAVAVQRRFLHSHRIENLVLCAGRSTATTPRRWRNPPGHAQARAGSYAWLLRQYNIFARTYATEGAGAGSLQLKGAAMRRVSSWWFGT